MLFSKLICRLFGRGKPATYRKPSQRRRTALEVETLEDRTVPAQITVTPGADGLSLAQAIQQANNNRSVENTIVFAASMAGQTITVGAPLVISKPIEIIGLGIGAGAVTISGGNMSSIFTLSGSGVFPFGTYRYLNVTINNLIMTSGQSAGNGGAINGLATATTTRLSLNNDSFQGNVAATNGGAIALSGNDSRLSVTNCIFNNNTAGLANMATNATGGAISILGASSQLSIVQGTFTNNKAIGGAADGQEGHAAGGAISLSGLGDSLQISDQTSFSQNSTSGGNGGGGGDGAAISLQAAQSAANTITGTTFNNNTSVESGGAIIFGAAGSTLTLRSDKFNVDQAGTTGGAIDNVSGGNLIVASSVFNGNRSVSVVNNLDVEGGAIHSNGGTVTLLSDYFGGNTSVAGSGGAVAVIRNCVLTVNWCWFNGVVGVVSADHNGGAISAALDSSVTINYSTFVGNIAGRNGGAVSILNGASLRIANDTFQGNTAAGSGGAISIQVIVGNLGGRNFTGNISSSFFQNNTASAAADGGGAIFLSQAQGQNNMVTTNITNCTFIANTAVGFGGALLVSSAGGATANLQSLTVTGGNNAQAGGGGGLFASVLAIGNVRATAPNVGNSIIAGNTVGANALGPDVFGTVNSQGFNLIGATDNSLGWIANMDRTGTAANPLNPGLNLVQGPTNQVGGVINGRVLAISASNVITLLPGSPALANGNPMLAGTPDQTGLNRPAAVAIGAYNPNGVLPPPARMGMVNPGPQNNVVGDTVNNVAVSASNVGSDPVNYVAFGLPFGLSIDPSTGTISGTIYYGDTSATPYSVTVLATDLATGNSAWENFSWTISQTTPTVSVTTINLTYGQELHNWELSGTSSVPGTYTFTSAAGTVLGAGNDQIENVTFAPFDTTDYATVTTTVVVNVAQATPSITWNNPADITYGTALSGTQLDATASVLGSFTYTLADGVTPAKGATLDAGADQVLMATFTPTDSTDYATVTSYVTINVDQITPTITWQNPSAIPYGTPLTGTQLDATASVAGGFSYTLADGVTPASGAVLNAGANQTLEVTFTPNDLTDYSPATASVTINVNQAAPSISWQNPAPILVGAALNGTQLDATANVAGTFTYTLADGVTQANGAVLGLGLNQTLNVTFTPTDSTDYSTATDSVTINVEPLTPAAPPILATVVGHSDADWPGEGELPTPGDTVLYFVLTGQDIDVVPAGCTLLEQVGALSMYETTNASDNDEFYNSVTGPLDGTRIIGVEFPAGTMVDQISTDSMIDETPSTGTTGTTQAANETALAMFGIGGAANPTNGYSSIPVVPGQTNPSPLWGFFNTLSTIGTTSCSVANPGDPNNYGGCESILVTLCAAGAEGPTLARPTITWNNPSAISYGTALSGTQLDATANVPGTFTYTLADGSTPALGALLGAGADQTLEATFTPTDTTDYATVTSTVTINVNKATPTLTVSGNSIDFTGSPDPATALIAGLNGVPGSSLEGVSPVLTYFAGSQSCHDAEFSLAA